MKSPKQNLPHFHAHLQFISPGQHYLSLIGKNDIQVMNSDIFM